jgi:hypothetical protein
VLYNIPIKLTGFESIEDLQKNQRQLIKETIENKEFIREPKWTEDGFND